MYEKEVKEYQEAKRDVRAQEAILNALSIQMREARDKLEILSGEEDRTRRELLNAVAIASESA